MKLFFKFFALFFVSTTLQAKEITCQHPDDIGIPIVSLKIENKIVTEASEVLRSPLTSNMYSGKKLAKDYYYSTTKSTFRFSLGSHYTQDFSLVVDLGAEPIKVTVESYDRDDAIEQSFELVNCN